MPEVRIDPLSGLRVLVADGRAERPNGLLSVVQEDTVAVDGDPFAEGNEDQTPPELWADRPDDSAADGPGWRVRVVPNRYPALDQTPADGDVIDSLGLKRGMPELLQRAPAHGSHEVIVNSPRQVCTLESLSRDELETATKAWASRIAVHAESPYVHLAVNEGAVAGSTLPHTHAQVWALPFVPPVVARERERTRAYFEHTQGRSLVEDLLVEEIRGGERLVAVDADAALIAPFASATPYRMMIVPRRPERRYDESPDRGTGMLFTALKCLHGVFGASPPLNLWLRTAPADAENFTWRIELAPRIVQPAGFELGTGVSINPVTPESAAAALKEHVPQGDPAA